MVESFMDSNLKKKKAKALTKEQVEMYKDYADKFRKFYDLCEGETWKECRDFIKEEIYNGLSLAPGDGGDWWLKYSWGLKCFIERAESHAKKYEEAVRELSK